MRRYAVFCGSYNLMIGGAKDLLESFETLEKAKEKVEQIPKENSFANWVQIFDKETEEVTVYTIVDGKLKERKNE
ncbi:hypothetical protein ACL7TT_14765 [Microbulbifer sp. 2304DJ12-6]|uniref:hypothetical protein n=1 Tax=Microbulbifer sp. 2304DJ12-6 TaxID=3233340 RepID=UPI0039AFDEDD